MIRLLLIIFLPLSSMNLQGRKWSPELITKQSILENHLKLIPEPLFEGLTQLVYVTTWNPRGYMLARKRASRLAYVSPVWFDLEPIFDENDIMVNVNIMGKKNINPDFIQSLRKTNPDIKIVPRFYFNEFQPSALDRFIKQESVTQKVAQTIANFCRQYGFDGLVLDPYSALADAISKPDYKRESLETIEHLGNVLRRNSLVTILSFPALVSFIEETDEKIKSISYITMAECASLLDSFDHLHLWTYSEALKGNRRFVHNEFLHKNIEHCGFSPKIMIGINFYGSEFDLTGYYSTMASEAKPVISKRFLEVLKDNESILTFNEKTMEHELTLVRNNSLIFYPSLTTLENRLTIVQEYNVGIAIWEYGQGLDYFTNLI